MQAANGVLDNLNQLMVVASQQEVERLSTAEQRSLLCSVLSGESRSKDLRDLRLEALLSVRAVAAALYLQRQTFHLSIVYFDAFLAHFLTFVAQHTKFTLDKPREGLVIALTCLHIAQKFNESQQIDLEQLLSVANSQAKLEAEGQPPIKADELIGLEQYVCHYVLRWKLGAPDGIRSYDGMCRISSTLYELSIYFSEKWDEFVICSMGWLIEQGFQILFWSPIPPFRRSAESSVTSEYGSREPTQNRKHENGWIIQNCKMVNTLMRFIDLVAMDPSSYAHEPLILVASCMYLMLGGKDVMGTFNFEYTLFQEKFLSSNGQFPIPTPQTSSEGPFGDPDVSQSQLSDSTLFYNSLVEQYLSLNFGLNLHDIRDTVKFVIKYFLAEIEQPLGTECTVLEYSRRFFKLTRDDVLAIFGATDDKSVQIEAQLAAYETSIIHNYKLV